LIALVIVVLVGAGFLLLRSNLEKQVKKQLNLLAEYVDKEPGEPAMTTLTKLGGLGKLFAETCTVTVDRPPMKGEYSSKEVMDRVNMARSYFSELHLGLYDISITFPSDSRAEVVLTMRIHGTRSGEKNVDTREVEFILEKPEKKWLISGVRMVEVLEQ
jgi:hypothetical protein